MLARVFTLLVCFFAVAAQPLIAGTIVDTGRLGYTTSWTRHATLSDAQAGIGQIGAGNTPQRDFAIYAIQGAPDYWTDANIALTNWYSGASNPSNTNFGFFQLYDDDSSTDTAFNSSWSADLTSFHLTITGKNAQPGAAGDSARYGEIATGAASATNVIFHDYILDVTFGGLNGVYNPVTGRYEDFGSFPTSVVGSITAIIENVGTVPARNGFYAVDLTLNLDSWAFANGHLNEANSNFASSNVVPEPASLAIWGLVSLSGVAVARRRRKAA